MICNVHERRVAASSTQVGALLATLASSDDQLWPVADWPPVRLDRALSVGATGGHGPIRYTVAAYEPGRRVVFTFDPETRIDGTHSFEVEGHRDGSTTLRHVLAGRPVGRNRLLWPLGIRWLHDALLEDALDRAEQSLAVGPAQPAVWPPWVRLLRRLYGAPADRDRVTATDTPPALVALAGLERPDFLDCYAVDLRRGMSRDVGAWYDALAAASTPPWFRPLIRVRAVLARGLRLDTAQWSPDQSPLQLRFRAPDTVVCGEDDRHLDFRALLHVESAADDRGRLLLATVVQRHNVTGRAYFALVRPFHRRIVPAILRHLLRHPPRRNTRIPADDLAR